MSAFTSTSSERLCHCLMLAYCSGGALANILLLTAGLRSPQVRKIPLNTLTFQMMVSDLIVQIIGALSTAMSVHTNTTPDARPTFCQTQGVLSTFGCSMGLCALTAIAISRYYVIVKKRHLTRRQYLYMTACCLFFALLNVAIMIHYPYLIDLNAGKLLCAPVVSSIAISRALRCWCSECGRTIYVRLLTPCWTTRCEPRSVVRPA